MRNFVYTQELNAPINQSFAPKMLIWGFESVILYLASTRGDVDFNLNELKLRDIWSSKGSKQAWDHESTEYSGLRIKIRK